MKKITVLALILILSLTITVLVGAKDSRIVTDAESREYPNELKGTPLTEDNYQQTGPKAVEQATYTDMWFKNNRTWVSTSSTDWRPVPGMYTSITTRYPSDLLITFSAEAATSANGRLYLRILVDGAEAQPGGIMFTSRTENYNSHSFSFYRTNIPAGTHTINVQWKSEVPSPEFVFVFDRTLSIIANGAGHP